MKKIVVAGGGVLGSQVAYQAAYCGFDVTIWLRSRGQHYPHAAEARPPEGRVF